MTINDSVHCRASDGTILAKIGVFATCKSVFWGAHPTTIRMLMGLSSVLWAITLVFDESALLRWPYQYMLTVMSPASWAVGFGLHFIGTFWRIFDHTPRIYWALCINALGCFLWISLTICINLRVGLFTPGSGLEVITSLFSVWVLVRTGLGKDMATP